MGRQDVTRSLDAERLRGFTRALLTDIRALEHMLREDMFETGVRRLGAEQELFLVNPGWRPAPVATDILLQIDGKEFTTELARFNLEINLDPLTLEAGAFDLLRGNLETLVQTVREEAHRHRAEVLLTGILPTLTKSDLTLANMTPRERYYALNDAVTRACGGCYHIFIQGTDELRIDHDSVMLEGCNTSFQIHLQVDADLSLIHI